MANENRATVEFDSGEHKVVAYTYFTSQEADTLEKVMVSGILVDTPDHPGQAVAKPKVPAENLIAYQRARVRAGLKTIDGSAGAAAFDDMPSDEAQQLVADLQKAAPRLFLAKKRTQDTPSPSSTNSETAAT
jgi:hypothetical protein